MTRITGTKIRAARVAAHLSQEQLADRAGIHRDCLRGWEGSSDAVPGAQYRMLCRVTDALESAGVVITDGGISLQRSATPAMSTIVTSEAVA